MENKNATTTNQASKNKRSRNNGFSLSLIMCVIVLLLIMGIGLLNLGMQSRNMAVRTSTGIIARSSADAGVTQALYMLNRRLKTNSWGDSVMPHAENVQLPFCNSSFSYKTDKYAVRMADGDYEDLYFIESVGKSGLSQKKVGCTLELQGLFEYAIFADDILLKNGTTVTSYNVEDDDLPLMIGTNSTHSGAIDTKLGVTVEGDVVVGPGGDPDVVINSARLADITGRTYPAVMKNKTAIMDVPQYLLEAPSNGEINKTVTISSSGKYESINLNSNVNSDSIKIDGDVTLYVTGDIRLGNGDELIIHSDHNADAQLIIFLGGNLIVDNGASLNNLTKDASKLKIFGLDTCEALDFKNSGSFYGAIYAPTADIHLYNSVQMYGAVVGKSFIQDVYADFHYDMSLREAEPHELGVRLVIKRWSEQ